MSCKRWIWKGDILVADVDWSRWKRLKSTPEGSMQRKCELRKWQCLPGRRWNSQNPCRRSTSETIHLNPGRPERGEEQEVFRGEPDRLFCPTPLQDYSTLDDAETGNDFWSIAGDQSLWQTFGGSDLLHSSHMSIQATLLCGKHIRMLQIRIVSRLWLCGRPCFCYLWNRQDLLFDGKTPYERRIGKTN